MSANPTLTNPKSINFRGQDKWDTRAYRLDEEINTKSPKLIGYYSLNESQELVEDLSELKYMTKEPGSTYLDLTYGSSSTKNKSLLTKHEPFFEYLSRHEDLLEKFESSNIENAGFIMSRGSLLQIGKIPTNRDSRDTFVAYLLNGAIYIKKAKELREITDQDAWGHKFRQYMLSTSAKCEPDTDEPVNQDREFNGVFDMKLGKDNIMVLSEIDGVEALSMESREDVRKDLDEKTIVDELNSRKFVKMATSLKRDDDPKFARYKSLQMWLKCFWCNANELYIGFKDNNGIVNEVKKLSLQDLENMGTWKSKQILSFTSEFLTFVKKCFVDKIPEDCDLKKLPEMKLFFQFSPSQYRGYKAISPAFLRVIPQPKDVEFTWLPDWYIEKKSSQKE